MMDDVELKLLTANLVLTIIIAVVGIYYAVQTTSPVQIQLGKTNDIYEPLLSKLDKHSEVAAYKGLYPGVVRITQNDLQFAKQNNLTFFNSAKEGDYFLTYPGMNLVYDFKADKIVNIFEQPKAPADLTTKLLAHPETADHANAAAPRVTRLDDQVLSAARANNQQFFALARSGDYLFEWNDLTLIYDYNNDKIINLFRRLVVPNDFVAKLMVHAEVASHANENPTITQLDDATIQQGKTATPQFFGNSKAGDYLLQWADLVVIYDYPQDKIVATFVPQTAPSDFLQKLTAHPELKNYESETPRLSIITADALPQLLQQFPNIYKNAKAGEYVVRYSDRLVIYDYENDTIVDIFTLQPQSESTTQ